MYRGDTIEVFRVFQVLSVSISILTLTHFIVVLFPFLFAVFSLVPFNKSLRLFCNRVPWQAHNLAHTRVHPFRSEMQLRFFIIFISIAVCIACCTFFFSFVI